MDTKKSIDQFYIPKDYVKSKVTPTWLKNSLSRGTKYTREQIKTMLKNPIKNEKKLKEVSNYLWYSSPIYQNIVYYMATLLTFDYIIYPDDVRPTPSTLETRFYSSAKSVSQAQVKYNFPRMTWRMLLQGDVYFYEFEDENNTIYKELPNNICELAFIDDNNIWRYYINFALVTQGTLYELPTELQIEYKKWVDGGKSKKVNERKIEGVTIPLLDSYHLVSPKGKALFVHIENNAKDYPYFASMFPDLITLEDDKEYLNEFIKEQNQKLIHLKVPTDSEGIPLMDRDTVSAYHESAKEHLPSSNALVTNPFEMEGITVDKSQQNGINIVESSDKIVKSDSGISSTMFEASTTNGLLYSVNADASKMYPLLYFFENIINYKIKNQKFKSTFLKVNQYNVADWHATYANDLQNGGSRFLYLSTSGIELYAHLRLSEFEKMIDLERLFVPKMNGNQMSGNDEGGRPEIADNDKADSTVKVQETE